MKVHDLDNEKTGKDECQIDEIKHKNVRTFDPDTLKQAEKANFTRCHHCLKKKENKKYIEIEVIKD